MNLQAKIDVFGIWVLFRIKASLSVEIPLVNIKSARIFFQVQDIATVNSDFVVEHEHAEPDLEG